VPERQQLDPQEAQPEQPAVVPDEAVVIPPAVVPAVAMPTGTHASEAPGGMHELIGMSSDTQRRRFVLQLQRTAGNAAVCRWLLETRARFLERHGDTGDDVPPPDENAPKSR
jgi:hypothetical protein